MKKTRISKKEFFDKASSVWTRTTKDIPDGAYKKVFVAGSAFDISEPTDKKQLNKSLYLCDALGERMASEKDMALITGATPSKSMPHKVVASYRRHGGKGPVIGITGDTSADIQDSKDFDKIKELYNTVVKFDYSDCPYGKEKFASYLYRDVPNGYIADAMVTVMGGGGTMGEASIAYHQGIPIASLKGSGGFSDGAKELFDLIAKQGQKPGKYMSSKSVDDVVNWLMKSKKKR